MLISTRFIKDAARDCFHGIKRRHHEAISINQKTADELERYLALPCDEKVAP